MVGGRQQAVPGRRRALEGERIGDGSAALDAARQCAGDGPADVAAIVAEHNVLGRDAVAGGRLDRFIQRRGRLQLQVMQVQRVGRMGDPVHRIQFAAGFAHRSQAGFAHGHLLGRSAFHQDGLDVFRRGLPATGGAQLARVRVVAPQPHQVERIGIAVGKTPGDVAVAAGDDQRRRTRQADADQAALPAVAVREAQRQPVPDIRQLQAQVHVVRDDRRAAGAAAAGQREVVAADRIGEADAGHLAHRHRIPAAPPGRRRGRQRGLCACDAGRVERRIPAAGFRQQEGALGRIEAGRQPAARQLARLLVALQIEIHRPHHQQRIGRRPAPRRAAGQHIFERVRMQRSQAVVDAGRIALDEGAFVRREALQRQFGAGAEAVQAVRAVERQGARPEQLGQLAGGAAAQQVHLEEALLAMHEAGGISQVEPAGAADGRHAVRIALDRHRRRQQGRAARAVELGQAGAQIQPGAEHSQ
jgi:hypothetical protein